LINPPIAALAALGAWRFLPENIPQKAARLDFPGVALLSLFLIFIIYPLTHGRQSGWPAWTFALLAASVPVFATFLATEGRVTRNGGEPLVDLQLFRNRAFATGLAIAFLFYCDSVFFLTFGIYLQTGLRWTPLISGLAILPFASGLVLGPPQFSCHRAKARRTCTHGRLHVHGHRPALTSSL
jgi:hypothetical protein